MRKLHEMYSNFDNLCILGGETVNFTQYIFKKNFSNYSQLTFKNLSTENIQVL